MKHLHFIQNSTIVRIQNMSSTIFHVKFWITLINIPVNMWRLHKRMVQTFHHILPLDIRHTIDHLKRRVWLPPVRIDMVVIKSILFKNEVKKGSSKIYIFLSPLDVNKTCSKFIPNNLLDMYPNIFMQFLHDNLSFETDLMANFSQKNIISMTRFRQRYFYLFHSF